MLIGKGLQIGPDFQAQEVNIVNTIKDSRDAEPLCQ